MFFFVRSDVLPDEFGVDEVLPDVDGCVEDDWLPEAPWPMFDVEFTSVELWFAEVELVVVLLPLPTFTPGLTLALALRSVLLTPTLAFTSTLGFTFSVRWLVSDRVALDGVELADPEMPFMLEPEVLPDEVAVPDAPFETPALVVVLVLGATYVLDDVELSTVVPEVVALVLPLTPPAAVPFE